jgi:hypothetical protein
VPAQAVGTRDVGHPTKDGVYAQRRGAAIVDSEKTLASVFPRPR